MANRVQTMGFRELLPAQDASIDNEETLKRLDELAIAWQGLFVSDPETAFDCAQVGFELADRLANRLRARFAALVGASFRGLRRYDEAEKCLDRAFEYLGELDPIQRADVFLKKAYLRLHQESFDAALHYTDEALGLLEGLAVPGMEGKILVCRGVILGTMGESLGSAKYHLRALSKLDPVENLSTFSAAVHNIAVALIDIDESDEVSRLLRIYRAVKNALPRSLKRLRLAMRWTEGIFFAKERNYRRAYNALIGVEEIQRRIGSPQENALLLIDIAEIELFLNRPERARVHLDRATQIMRKQELDPKIVLAVERVRDQVGKEAARAWSVRNAVADILVAKPPRPVRGGV